jgi:hypothetical protein
LASGQREVLRQSRHKFARGPQVSRRKSFCEAAAYTSEIVARLITLSAFSKQTGQVYRRPKLQRESGLRPCDYKCFSQTIQGRVAAILRHTR